MSNLANLLHEKEIICLRLEKLIFGSIEIRETNSKKYVYVHARINGKLITKYIGEYSQTLYNTILENNVLARQYKKQLRQIQKELDELNYSSTSLSYPIKANIDLAKKKMVDLIYRQAKLEGVATTYSDTETIVEGGKVVNMSIEDVTKVINLKHAWEFVLSQGVISYPTNFILLCQINGIVEENLRYDAGKIRNTPVKITGTQYLPPIPLESLVKEELEDILKSKISNLDKTIELLLYVMKRQIFGDGNKRTAILFANHYLINKGLGLIAVPENLIHKFKTLLIDYYENKSDKIKSFLKKECLIK